MYRVPDDTSSSPPHPSTPDSRRSKSTFNIFSASNPSTTPAGPPPSSFTTNSTTPAGPPPSSVLGSSRFNSAAPLSSFKSPLAQHAQRSSPLRPNGAGGIDFDAMEEDEPLDSFQEGLPGLDDRLVSRRRQLDISAVAKGLAGRTTQLAESDDLILGCENIVQKLDDFVQAGHSDGGQLARAFSSAVEDILLLCRREQGAKPEPSTIGPGEDSSPIAKANFLISLALSIHHPPSFAGGTRDTFGGSRPTTHAQTIPEVLLNWLDTNHNLFPNDFHEVLAHPTNPCADERFWDVVLSLSLRGKVQQASQLFKQADFQYAFTALEDGAETPGYHGKQLGNTQRVINRAIQVLDDCPALQNGNWKVTDEDWRLFRKKANQALSDLEIFAQGQERVKEDDAPFAAEHFGMQSHGDDNLSMSLMSRRAESRVPWTIYQNLQYLYAQLLGMHNDIVASCADWVEAAICTTVWWNGDQDSVANQNLAASRRSYERAQKPRPVDMDPRTAYLGKLGTSLQQVLTEYDDAQLQINTADAVQVGLACVFTDDIEGLLGILRSWSATISTAVVEIASLGGWLGAETAPAKRLMNQFDESDLMVLSYAQEPKRGVKRDEILTQYASLLFQKATLESRRTSEKVEGWELAISVLGRLDDEDRGTKLISNMLDELKLTTAGRVEKVVSLCSRIGLREEAQKISEKFADGLTETSNNYGDALLYYARAHKPERVKDVMNLLISFCLVQSIAYPPAADLDSTLRSMISQPKQSLAQLNTTDPEAAQLLSASLSGYATLRRYYELRDQPLNPEAGPTPALRPLARKKEAAALLMTLVASAADSIHGGLYDDGVDSAIPVDGLLVLLGEALVFLNPAHPRALTRAQTTALLRAAEDVATCPHSIRAAAAELLASALQNHADGGATGAPSPHATLKKSLSSLSDGFSLVGSAVLGSRSTIASSSASSSGPAGAGGLKADEGSGVLVARPAARGWDWRAGLGRGVGADGVLRLLRLGLARELAASWTEAL